MNVLLSNIFISIKFNKFNKLTNRMGVKFSIDVRKNHKEN